MFTELSGVDPWGFRRASLIYPHPVAMAAGRLLRASSIQEYVDACLKAAEILARYLAGAALSSIAARENLEARAELTPFSGDLSFGHFLTLVQQAAKTEGHPLGIYLSAFRAKKQGKGTQRGKADTPLVALLELRNELGHDLAALARARAETIVKNRLPDKTLLDAFGALEGVLGLPLFVVDNVRWEREQFIAQRLLLMGESPDPVPDSISLSQGIESLQPYLAVDNHVLPLPPSVVWGIDEQRQAYRLLFLDSVENEGLRYKTMESSVLKGDAGARRLLADLFGGVGRPAKEVKLYGGTSFVEDWQRQRPGREAAGRAAQGLIPWETFDQETLDWYARRLPTAEGRDPKAAISRALLDGRTDAFSEREITQVTLLFGRNDAVRKLLGRDMIDLRMVGDPEQRWAERITKSDNLLKSLVTTIDFFTRHVAAAAAEDLSRTTGNADYIAMREALVNQFIHQDYGDPSAPAQIELSQDRASFFNTGYSLVSEDSLVEGGKSQSRNPLIARALRLIGFAELAGSGIRAMQHAWRAARRRPPVFATDRSSNTFTLTLDWRRVPNAYDDVWRKRIGAQLTEPQAAVLNLATDSAGITIHQAVAGTGLSVSDAGDVLTFLIRQVLVEERGGRYYLAPHLQEALK